jgi:signal transduction histidine kinase/CheY-like chemotaxis protein
VVEDEELVAATIVTQLERLGYSVVGTAASAEVAIERARKEQPELVLMDVQLRGEMDGTQAAQRIQAELQIPVVFVTAYADQATIARVRETNPFGYVLKPFSERDLDTAIQVALFRHRSEQALVGSERRLEAILGSIGDAVIATDRDKRITFLNPTAEGLLEWTSDRAKGRPLLDVVRGTRDGDGRLWLSREHDRVPVELVESSFSDGVGPPSGYVIVARDMTEPLRAQAAHDRELVERAARAAAEKEHARARLKSDISAMLVDITQSEDMVPALGRVVDLIATTLANWCVLQLDHGPKRIRVSGHVHDEGQARAFADVVDRFPPRLDAPYGVERVARDGQAQLLREVGEDVLAQIATDSAHLDAYRRARIESFVCVPLRARERVLGALALVSTDASHRFDEAELSFAQQVADRIGIAIDNARLYRETREAKETAERLYEAEQAARAEAQSLLRIGDAISAAQLDLDAVVQRVTDEARALVGASYGAFFYNVTDESGDRYTLYTLSGAPREAFENFGLPRKTPIFAPTFDGVGTVRIDDVRQDPRYGRVGPHHGMPPGHLPVRSYLAVPVVSRLGEVHGGLFFAHVEPERFTEQHERMAAAVAAQAAVAIDNAQLFRAAREAEEKQSRLVRELERAVRFSETFVGILGHDLRNPLSSITMAAALVLDRAESARVSKPVARILNSARRMTRMIDHILDFTRIRMGRGIPLDRRTVALTDVCRVVVEELNAARGPLDVELDVRDDTSGVWDEDRLTQLVSNLLGNAVQHRVPDTPIRVSIDGSQADLVAFRVRNDGTVPPELLPNLFEPLHGAEPSKQKGSSGLGLGLHISQQIAAAHGGSIRVESDPAVGQTLFVVELPRTFTETTESLFEASLGKDGKKP